MNKNKNILKFSILLFLASSSYALINVQLIPYLIRLGYSVQQRGLIVSFSAFISIFGQILSGMLSDHLKSVKKLFIGFTLILIASMLLGYMMNQPVFGFHFWILGFGMMVFRIATNLAETWLLGLEDTKEKFGLIRGTGSVGWAFFSLISAFIISYVGYKGLALVFAFISLLIVFLSVSLPDIKVHTDQSAVFKWQDINILFRNRDYVLLIFIYFMGFLVMNADGFTVTDLIFELGGDEKIVGLRWFIQGLIELPAFAMGNALLVKLNNRKFLQLTLFFVFIRFLLVSFATTNNQIIIISLLQMVTFPFLILGQRMMILEETPSNLHAIGQMIAVSVTMSLSSIVTPLIASYLSQYLSNHRIILLFSIITIIPLLATRYYKRN